MSCSVWSRSYPEQEFTKYTIQFRQTCNIWTNIHAYIHKHTYAICLSLMHSTADWENNICFSELYSRTMFNNPHIHKEDIKHYLHLLCTFMKWNRNSSSIWIHYSFATGYQSYIHCNIQLIIIIFVFVIIQIFLL
jgi:hypothetical protein